MTSKCAYNIIFFLFWCKKSKTCPSLPVKCQTQLSGKDVQETLLGNVRRKRILSSSVAFPTFRTLHLTSSHPTCMFFAFPWLVGRQRSFSTGVDVLFFHSLHCSSAHKLPGKFWPGNFDFSNMQDGDCLGMWKINSNYNSMKRIDQSGQILFSQLLLEEATYPCWGNIVGKGKGGVCHLSHCK